MQYLWLQVFWLRTLKKTVKERQEELLPKSETQPKQNLLLSYSLVLIIAENMHVSAATYPCMVGAKNSFLRVVFSSRMEVGVILYSTAKRLYLLRNVAK